MSTHKTYAMPIFPVGTGLGNRLFHWCDAKVILIGLDANLFLRYGSGFPWENICVSGGSKTFIWAIFWIFDSFRCLPTDYSWQRSILQRTFLPEIRISQHPEILDRSNSQTVLYVSIGAIMYLITMSHFVSWLRIYWHHKPSLLDTAFNITGPYIGMHVRLGDGFRPRSLIWWI